MSIYFDLELSPQEKGREELSQRNVRVIATMFEVFRRKAGRSWNTLSGNFSFLLSEFPVLKSIQSVAKSMTQRSSPGKTSLSI